MHLRPCAALSALLLLLPTAACADQQPGQGSADRANAAPAIIVSRPVSASPPRLVVAIAVDQFSADLFAQYRQHFTGGLARLMEGAVFPSAFQSHAATETCPGHATILTGVHPARSGIVANSWVDVSLAGRADRKVYCAEDERDPASTAREPVVSAVHLRVPTLGEWMKRADPRSRNVAVSAKDRAVMMMGGHDIDAAYWFLRGQFTTLKGRQPGPAAQARNAAVADLVRTGAPALEVPAWCAARQAAVGAGRAVVGFGRFALAPGQTDAFRVSPRMDGATVDLALDLVGEMQLGRGPAPDLLSVSLSATDYIGHAMGNEGQEMCIQMAALDRTVGRLLAGLDASGADYMVVLTADHGGLDLPERLRQQALPGAVRVDPALGIAPLNAALAAQLNLGGAGQLVFGDGFFGDFSVTKALAPPVRARVIAALAARLRAHRQVAAAFTAAELAKVPVPRGDPQDWSLIQRARASFDPQHSGDVVMLLRRAVVPIAEPSGGSVATHGSAWDYDRRVPLLFWRKGLPGLEQAAPVETVDIAPTLAATLRLAVPPGSFDGRCLDLDGSSGNTCN